MRVFYIPGLAKEFYTLGFIDSFQACVIFLLLLLLPIIIYIFFLLSRLKLWIGIIGIPTELEASISW